MHLRILHTPLSAFVAEELQHLVERLIRIVHDIRECLPLTVVKKLFSRDVDAWHTLILADGLGVLAHTIIAATIVGGANIVSALIADARPIIPFDTIGSR